MTMELEAKFRAEGFEVGKDVSSEEWTKLVDEFTVMYNDYATMSNQIIDRLNEIWEKYEYVKLTDESMKTSMATAMMRDTMGIKEGDTYGDWMKKWAEDICVAVDATAMLLGYKLRSDIFMEDDIPIFRAKFNDNPKWKIQMTLEAIKN